MRRLPCVCRSCMLMLLCVEACMGCKTGLEHLRTMVGFRFRERCMHSPCQSPTNHVVVVVHKVKYYPHSWAPFPPRAGPLGSASMQATLVTDSKR